MGHCTINNCSGCINGVLHHCIRPIGGGQHDWNTLSNQSSTITGDTDPMYSHTHQKVVYGCECGESEIVLFKVQ